MGGRTAFVYTRTGWRMAPRSVNKIKSKAKPRQPVADAGKPEKQGRIIKYSASAMCLKDKSLNKFVGNLWTTCGQRLDNLPLARTLVSFDPLPLHLVPSFDMRLIVVPRLRSRQANKWSFFLFFGARSLDISASYKRRGAHGEQALTSEKSAPRRRLMRESKRGAHAPPERIMHQNNYRKVT